MLIQKPTKTMNKKLVKFTVFTISILAANLLGDYAGDYLTSFKNDYKPLTFTLLAMGVIVLIFYPLFDFLEKWFAKLSKTVVKEGKSRIGKNLGLLLVFFVSIIALSYFYAKMWYGINIFDLVINGGGGNLF